MIPDELEPGEEERIRRQWARDALMVKVRYCLSVAWGAAKMLFGAVIVGTILFLVLLAVGEQQHQLAAPCVALGGHYQAAGLGYPEVCWAPDGITRLFP